MKVLKNALIVLATTLLFLAISNTRIFAKTVIVNTDTLKLRKEASTDSATLELLNNGQKLEYIDETGDWYKVKVNGITGYVHKDYIKLEQDNTSEVNSSETQTKPEEEIQTEPEVNPQVTEISNQDTNIAEEILPNTEMKVSKDCKTFILPLINSNVIGQLKKDTNVTVISKVNGWVYIETPEMNVWIRKENLMSSTIVSDDIEPGHNEQISGNEQSNSDETQQNTELADVEITQKTMYINSTSVYVRKGPGTEYEIIDSLILNNGVTVIAENGDWYKVKVNNKTGYIAKRLLSTSTTQTTSRGDSVREEVDETPIETATNTSNGEQIVEYAKKYLGCKYVYGASGPNTFDCSGFTMYVLKNFGVTLSHSATAQSKVGSYVAKENLLARRLSIFYRL